MKNLFTQLSDILAIHKLVITGLLIAISFFTMAFRFMDQRNVMKEAVTPIQSKVDDHSRRLDGIDLKLSEMNGKLDVIIRYEMAHERAK